MAGRFVTVARAEDGLLGSVVRVEAGEEEIALAHVDGLRTYEVRVEDGEVQVEL